jgi:hypothetical protein
MSQRDMLRNAIDDMFRNAHVRSISPIDCYAQPISATAFNIGDELVTFFDAADIFAYLICYPGKLMPQRDRRTIEVAVLLDQQVAAAYPSRIDFHQNFVRTDLRYRHLPQLDMPYPGSDFLQC